MTLPENPTLKLNTQASNSARGIKIRWFYEVTDKNNYVYPLFSPKRISETKRARAIIITTKINVNRKS